MKQALIFQGQLIEVAIESFPVSAEMNWIDVADDVTVETHQYDEADNSIKPFALALLMRTYQELRAAAYPPIADYLDGIVKNDIAQVQSYKDACL